MKVKTAELIGPALDWAVAVCEGLHIRLIRHTSDDQVRPVEVDPTTGKVLRLYRPSECWDQGGPIIEREVIYCTSDCEACAGLSEWDARIYDPDSEPWQATGPTQLIAAMRCYVAFKLGDEVEIPEELL